MYNKILSKYINNELISGYSCYDLTQIEHLLDMLGNPHHCFKSVHIAGTNGKGTTASLISSVLINAGYKTGLYTSPHLIKLNERININYCEISDKKIYDYALRIDKIITENHEIKPTYFDILTSIAFLHFADSEIDIAVIETGLGGKLDSTNVLMPLVSVITEISIDHTSVLGDTIELIAGEKAGIIKNNVPIVSSCISQPALDIISQKALTAGSSHFAFLKDYRYTDLRDFNSGYLFNYIPPEPREPVNNLYIPVRPEHQVRNAASALTALFLLKDRGFTRITADNMADALKKFNLKGRFQVLHENPFILFDAAHNYDALKNLFAGVKKYHGSRKLNIILSIMSDKINPRVKELIYPYKDSILYFRFNDSRLYIPENKEFCIITSDINCVKEFIFSNSGQNPVNLFTGTFRLYKYVLDIIRDI
jgi:dihydrofolate synthase/folylpolyglutamate synthase